MLLRICITFNYYRNTENFNYVKKNEELNETLKMLQGEKDEMYQRNFEMELSLKKYHESQKIEKDTSKDHKDKKSYSGNNTTNNKLLKEV